MNDTFAGELRSAQQATHNADAKLNAANLKATAIDDQMQRANDQNGKLREINRRFIDELRAARLATGDASAVTAAADAATAAADDKTNAAATLVSLAQVITYPACVPVCQSRQPLPPRQSQQTNRVSPFRHVSHCQLALARQGATSHTAARLTSAGRCATLVFVVHLTLFKWRMMLVKLMHKFHRTLM
jgi:hypothetical protein